MNHFTLTQNFPCTSQTLYDSWLNSESHSAMTGSDQKPVHWKGLNMKK